MSAQGEDRSDFQAVMPPVDRNGKKLDFVVFKATEGTGWTSKTYKQNVANAKAAGVPYGSYHFFHPSLNVDAQIALFLAFVAENGGLNPGTILACDSEIQSGVSERLFLSDGPNRSDLLESSSLSGLARVRDGVSFPTQHLVDSATPTSASVSLVNSATKSFLDGVRTGVEVALGGDYCQEMLYSFLGMLPQLSASVDYPLWVADFTSKAPASVRPWRQWDIWQFAGGGGRGGSDQDAYNGTAEQFRSWITAKLPKENPVTDNSNLNITIPNLATGAKDVANQPFIVHRLQGLLLACGISAGLPTSSVLKIDGVYGPKTVEAVKEVQVFAGIYPDINHATGRCSTSEWKFLVAGIRSNG